MAILRRIQNHLETLRAESRERRNKHAIRMVGRMASAQRPTVVQGLGHDCQIVDGKKDGRRNLPGK